MNNKNNEKNKQNIQYITDYKKSHYKNIKLECKFELFEKIENYCNDMGISKQKLLLKSVEYVIDNDLYFSEIAQKYK